MALIFNKPSAAADNAIFLQGYANRCEPYQLPKVAGTIYIDRPLRYRPVVGCGALTSQGSGGYSITPGSPWGAITQRIQQVGSYPIFILSGAGFRLNGPLELVGSGSLNVPAICVEGRADPATGRHYFRDILFSNWDIAFSAAPGYDGYWNKQRNDQYWTADENHADNCKVIHCETMRVDRVFHSGNQQAVNWKFYSLVVNEPGLTSGETILHDCVRGGLSYWFDPVLCHRKVVMVRVCDYSPNNCQFIFRDVQQDRFPGGCSLTVFRYAGPRPTDADLSWMRWEVFFQGYTANKFNPNFQFIPYEIPYAPAFCPISTSGFDIDLINKGPWTA